MKIVDWTSPEWACNCFPQVVVGQTAVRLDDLIAVAQSHLDKVTEADVTARCEVLHVAHILVTLQGDDGLWPDRLDLRTGRGLAAGRSAAPVALFRRLNAMLESTEFDPACRWAETASLPSDGTQTAGPKGPVADAGAMARNDAIRH